MATTIEQLEAAWSRQTAWDGISREADGREVTVASLVFARWREVEVHRVDLGLGYGPGDWPGEYVREDLGVMEMRWNARRPMGMTGLPDAALEAPPHTRLAWLLGRAEIDGLDPGRHLLIWAPIVPESETDRAQRRIAPRLGELTVAPDTSGAGGS